MATKKCPNGHVYDASIYGDNCPFCPESGHTHVINQGGETKPTMPVNGTNGGTKPTIPLQDELGGGGHTVIRHTGQPGAPSPDGGRKIVGLLVSYTWNPAGEVFNIYEGRNIIGRAHSVDISFNKDEKMSSTHLLILYREAEGVFWAVDQNSSNGTFINGVFASDRMKIQTNDVIVIGATKMVFLGIPNF